MKDSIRKRYGVLAASCCLLLGSAGLRAEEAYPDRALKVISTQGVGGGVDALLRAIGNALAERTGKGFVVESRPGANGLLATNACAGAKPDGYTVCLVNTQFSLLPSIQSKPAYDPVKDFEPVTHIVTASLALAAQKSVPVNNLAELIEYSKKNPGKLNYIALGAANPVDLGLEQLMRQHGIKWTGIPYKGAADGGLAFAAGDVHLMFFTSLNVLAATANGDGKMLFVTGDEHLYQKQDVPTLAETGFPNPNVSGIWFGLIAPPGTPLALREKLAAHVSEILKRPDIVTRARDTGYQLVGDTPEKFGAFIKKEAARGAVDLADKPKIN